MGAGEADEKARAGHEISILTAQTWLQEAILSIFPLGRMGSLGFLTVPENQ